LKNNGLIEQSLAEFVVTRKARLGYKLEKLLFGKYEEIPEDWKSTTYGDVTNRITYGFTNPMPETNNGPWMITATNIKEGRINYETSRKTDWKSFKELLSSKSRPKKGTVLITKDGTLGEVAIVDKENICINQSVASIEPDKKDISSEYLLLSLQSRFIKKLIEVFSPQTTIRHIYITDIPKWKLFLPPKSEQQKIASNLSNVDALISSYDNIIENTKVLKRGLIQQLLTKGIGHTKFKKVTLKQKFLQLSIPESWDVNSIEKICQIIDTPHYTSPIFNDGTVPVITTSDCNPSGMIDYSKVKFTSRDEYLKRSKVINPEKGDVLFTREAPLGIAQMVDKKEIAVGQRIVLLKFDNDKMDDKFLVLFLNSHIGKIQSDSLAIKTTVERVNIRDIRKFKIPIPPIHEQKMITSILSEIESIILHLGKNKAHFESLKKGLTQKLLTGHIRVNTH